MIQISQTLTLPADTLEYRTTRAGGPGGQHVNTTDSAVQLRFDAKSSGVLKPDVYARLRRIAGQKMTKDGVVIIDASEHRSQARNRAEAAERLVAMIQQALVRPKKRIPTKPSRATKRRRLDAKTRRGDLKRLRGKPDPS